MKNNHRVLWLALVIACLVFTALTFVAYGRLRGSRTRESKNTAQTGVKRSAYVRRSSLSPKLVSHLNAMGDRLEKPGRERLHLTGTLSRVNDSQTQEVVAVFEFPERLRLTIKRGSQTRVISFDGARSNADAVDEDLIETLVYGSAEHFFDTQMRGMATRLLGSRFLLHRGSTADYNSPYYDVYKVTDERGQLRLYYFNSDTLLLERVAYEITRNGSTVKVEERLGDWTREQGQQVARRIERFENGESVFVLTVRAAQLSARADDGVFSN
jgi:hypothetical protein